MKLSAEINSLVKNETASPLAARLTNWAERAADLEEQVAEAEVVRFQAVTEAIESMDEIAKENIEWVRQFEQADAEEKVSSAQFSGIFFGAFVTSIIWLFICIAVVGAVR